MTMPKFNALPALALAAAILLSGTAPAQDAKTPNLAAYAGHYELAPGYEIIITTEANHLFAQVTGQEKAEVFPDGTDAVAWKIVEARATFDRAADGHITGLVMHQGGNDVPAKRVD
jgi:hypothetical protein